MMLLMLYEFVVRWEVLTADQAWRVPWLFHIVFKVYLDVSFGESDEVSAPREDFLSRAFWFPRIEERGTAKD